MLEKQDIQPGQFPWGTVPRQFDGETIVCVATGPSLTDEDVQFCRGRARVIAIKQAVQLAPWADALYACDGKYWKYYAKELPQIPLRYGLDPGVARYGTTLRNTGETGLELKPNGLRTGKNSGYQAINLAVHLGARRIVLLGYDLKIGASAHFFGEHPWGGRPPVEHFRPFFSTLVEPLKDLGIEIVNASRRTALTCFECTTITEALAA